VAYVSQSGCAIVGDVINTRSMLSFPRYLMHPLSSEELGTMI
jgi:hypothetical protein